MIKKHLPLIVAIALPIIFIGILAVAILVPSMNVDPRHDFVYTDTREQIESPYVVIQYKNGFVLKDGKITTEPLESRSDRYLGIPKEEIEFRDAPKLYYYSVTEDTSREISLQDAQKLSLVAGPSSPDGYNVKFEYNNDGIFELFGRSEASGYVITKGAGQKPLNGMARSEYYYGSEGFSLIGWVN